MTGFIQVNTNQIVNADDKNSGISYIFDLNKNINLTQGLVSDNVVDVFNINKNKKQKKDTLKNVNAIKIDQKTLIIKGFNENADNSLLDTIDLNINNINSNLPLSTPTDLSDGEIVSVKIDVAVNDGVTELTDNTDDIVEYEVVSGDTLSSIAEKHNVSIDTILWANDLNSKSAIKIGQKLVILPVSGVSYKVKKGDTVSGLADRFGVKERDIVDFNKTENNMLIVGETIVIPGGKITSKQNTINNSNNNSTKSNNSINNSQFARPIAGGIKTQGLHGYNGIDIGAPIGTPIFASLDGVVTLVRGGDSWNGGYGNYIVIKHKNGVQTLYAHLSSISVVKGQSVSRGQNIGRSGNTGRSTGPHLHFEVRGTRNPF